jgi:hypothetical protein
VIIQDARVAAKLLALLQCGDDVLDVTPAAGADPLGVITFARYGQRLDVRVEHQRIEPSATGQNGHARATTPKRVSKIRPGKVEFLRRNVNGHGAKRGGRRRSA